MNKSSFYKKIIAATILCLLSIIIISVYFYQDKFKADTPVSVDTTNETVLIIVNSNSPESLEVGAYYQNRRQIATENMLSIDTTTQETMTSYDDFLTQVKAPIGNFLSSHPNILYIVTTFGVPNRIAKTNSCDETGTGCLSVDALLTNFGSNDAYNNPYYKANANFSSQYMINGNRMYIVSRLDGPSAKIAKGLVDKAIYAEKYLGPENGKGYMSGEVPGLEESNSASVETQCNALEQSGFECVRDYYTWISSSNYYLPAGDRSNALWHSGILNYYHNVWQSWNAGAIAFNYRSYTAKRSIRQTDLPEPISVSFFLAADVTGTAGVVNEPYSYGTPLPSTFYYYFLSKNYNFAESMFMSFYSNTQKILIVGDPLYKLSFAPATDNEPPLITNFDYEIIGDKIEISWQNSTSENGSPEIAYGELSYGNTPACENTIKDTSSLIYYDTQKENYLAEHHFTIDYDPAQNYYFTASATDPAGNVADSNILSPEENPSSATISNLKSFTYQSVYSLIGVKSTNVAIITINGIEATIDDQNNTWSTLLDLSLGENIINIAGEDQYGTQIEPFSYSIRRRKAADANDDSFVNLIDLSLLSFNWKKTSSTSPADFNEDGTIGLIDLSILSANWERTR